jgi:hypothetical protein
MPYPRIRTPRKPRSGLLTGRPGRLVAALAALAFLAAACTGGDDPGAQEEADSTGSDEAGAVEIPEGTAPVELAITPPAGYTAAEGAREVPVTDQLVDYVFNLDGGAETSKIIVSSYLLPEVPEGDYEARLEFIHAYLDSTGYEYATMNDRATIVHRREGVMVFSELTDTAGNPLTQQNHFLFASNHLILVTCQWHDDFAASYQGCQEVTQNFPFPEWWI